MGTSSCHNYPWSSLLCTYTDDKTHLTYIYFLQKKSETFQAYKDFETTCEVQHKAKIHCLHSDCGGEYTGKEFVIYLKSKGMKQKLTVHDTLQHNGVAEYLNCTILEKVRTMLHASRQPNFLWGEAARHAVWLRNHTPTKALNGRTPFEAVYNVNPNLWGMHEWGCRVWVRNESSFKLGGRVDEGVWVGFDDFSKGSRVFWPAKRSVTVEQNVYFKPSGIAEPLKGEENATIKKPALPKVSQNNAPATDPLEPENQTISTTSTVSPRALSEHRI
jgi:hypothetical protein